MIPLYHLQGIFYLKKVFVKKISDNTLIFIGIWMQLYANLNLLKDTCL